jgi:protoporphyrinogen/coproporphyrinogen III oxidase
VTRVVVAGGGISGLTLAFELVRRRTNTDPIHVIVLEASARTGGNLRTEHEDGFICEYGPNGFLDNAPDTLALVRTLALQDRLLVSSEAARRRFVYHDGRLHPLPENPLSFLASPLLPISGRLRVLAEPFAPRRPEGDETIHAFASRRIGREAAEMLIDPMVSGVFAGNAAALSLRACFPKMWQMESEHGGLVRALIANRRKSSAPASPVGGTVGRLTSFTGGVQDLVQALTGALSGHVRTGERVSAVLRQAEEGVPWRVITERGDALDAEVVVLSCGASAAAAAVENLDATLAATLRHIPAAPIVVVALGYERASLGHALDGFGFLIPRREGLRVLGVLWDSSIFPNRAAGSRALMRVMLGGAHDPGAVTLEDDELVRLAREGLQQSMGVVASPAWRRVIRHDLGIPQYTVGHLDRLASIDERLAHHSGLLVAGNSYRGVSINACISEARSLAERISTDASLRSTAAQVARSLVPSP